jgi:hypothetical protein
MENIQKGVKDYNNIVSIDSNFSLNDSNIDDNVSYFKVTQKNGEIEMVLNEPYIDYNDLNNHDNNENKEVDNSDDNLSEFSQYREFEHDYEDDLECGLDFNFDFDIIFTPDNNSELLKLTEIKSKIVNRIKLNAMDLSHIKKIEDDEKFSLIKLFNHMV